MFCIKIRHPVEWQSAVLSTVAFIYNGGVGGSIRDSDIVSIVTTNTCRSSSVTRLHVMIEPTDLPITVSSVRLNSCLPPCACQQLPPRLWHPCHSHQLIDLLTLLFQRRLQMKLVLQLLLLRHHSGQLLLNMRGRCQQLVMKSGSVQVAWCSRLLKLLSERVRLLETLAWLSTLGGAFSALGDSNSDCAVVAGRISVRQLQLSCSLGAVDIQLRCQLFLALSCIQQRQLKAARQLLMRFRQLRCRLQLCATDRRLDNMYTAVHRRLKLQRQQLKQEANDRHLQT